MVSSYGDRVEACRTALAAAARESGMVMSGDGRVSESDAARLLGYSASHLKALRLEGGGPSSYAAGMNGSRRSYRLADLAGWIEMSRDGG